MMGQMPPRGHQKNLDNTGILFKLLSVISYQILFSLYDMNTGLMSKRKEKCLE